MKKIIKKNKIFIVLGLLAIMSVSLLLIFWQDYSKEVFAEDVYYGLEAECKKFTNSVKFFDNEGNEHSINEYEQYIEETFSPGYKDAIKKDDKIDEWIKHIVPVQLFENKEKDFLYVGWRYGFYFNYDEEENTYLIYLILHEFDIELSGHIIRRLTPLYYENYRFDSESKNVSLEYKPYGSAYYYQKYSDYKKIHLKNIAFNGNLYNINNLNIGEDGYIAEEDNGGYFIGGSYKFKGYSTQSGKADFCAELFLIAVGAFGGVPLGCALAIGQALIVIENQVELAKKDFREEITNENDYSFQMTATTRFEQIAIYDNILKDYLSALDTPNDKTGALFGIKHESYVQSTFYYSFANETDIYNTAFVGKIRLDVVEEKSNGFGSTFLVPISTQIESNDYHHDIYTDSRIKLVENQETPIYSFPKRENKLTFTAPENGIYTFESNGQIKNRFIADKGNLDESVDGRNQKLVVELRKGEKFDFTSKNLYNQKGVYQIRTEFTPQQIEAEETKTLTVKAGESEFFAFDNTDGAGFNYSLDENGNYSISVAYEDRNNVLETVSMLNMKSGAIAHCESGKYIIKITNNGDKDAKLEFNVSHGSALDIGQAYELEVGRNALYKLGEPKASSIVKFATVSEIPLKISLLDEQFNVIIESDKITDAEIKSVIDENKTYYLYIENDRESAAKIALEVAYDLFKLTLGNNELAGKHLSSNIYELSLTSDARITISASHNIEYSVYDEKWELLELQDGAYVISKDAKYFIVARGEESAFNFDISLECTEDLEGMIGADEYCYIRYIPTKTDYYDVSGVEVFEWFDEHLRTFSDKMEEGSVYYLKITGEENTPYNISIQRRATLIPLRSSFDATNKLYFIEIEESGAYAITTWISNGVTGTFDILDWENNLISADNKAGEKHIAHFEKGLYYIDMKTNDGVTMLINAHNSDNAQLNNTLIEGVNHNVEIKSNTDNTFIVNASASSEYYLMLTYVSTRLQIFITVTDSSLNEIPFEELTLQPTEQGKRYGVKLKLEEGKTYFISIYYAESDFDNKEAELLIKIPTKIQDVYLKASGGELRIKILEKRKQFQTEPIISMGRIYVFETDAENVIWQISDTGVVDAKLENNRLCVNIDENYTSRRLILKAKDDLGEIEIILRLEFAYKASASCDGTNGYRTNLISISQLNYKLDARIETMDITMSGKTLTVNGDECSYFLMYDDGFDIFANNARISSVAQIRFNESGMTYKVAVDAIPFVFTKIANISFTEASVIADMRGTSVSTKTYNLPSTLDRLILLGNEREVLTNIRFVMETKSSFSIHLININAKATNCVLFDFSLVDKTEALLSGTNKIIGKSPSYLIKAKAIVFEGQDGSLQVIGSNGENGANGAKAGSNSYSAGENGGNGDDGLKGENGTGALSCTSVANKGDCSILLQGGNGGNGGYGRNGGTGGHGRTNAVKGGAGGRGGDGGDGGYGGVGCPVSPTEGIIDIIKGKPGCGGDGGSGGYGGSGSDGVVCRINGEFAVVYSYSGGVGGNGGNAGECGAGDHACKLPAGGAGGNGGYGGDGASYQEGKDFKYTGASAGGRGGNGGTGCIGGDGGHGGTGAKGLNATLTSNGGDGYRGGRGGNGGNGGNYYEVDGHGGAAGDGGYGGEGGEGGEKKSVFKGGAKGPDGSSGSNGAAGKYVAPGSNTGESSGGDSCVATGTLITLADGRQVPVETLKGDEMLLVWDIFNGKFEISPILFVDKDEERMYNIINLRFSDGTSVKVIDEHGFWDFDLNKYVFLREDADKYIGHYFNKQTVDEEGNFGYTKVRLEEVEITQEYTAAWSPVTYGHLCYYVNGMLSMPGATGGLINIFDVDAKTMTVDKQAYEVDIELYGLYTYEEFSSKYEIPQEIFEAFGGKYLKAAIGKGLITEDEISALITRYSAFWQTND